jgi:transcriptional regulator with XRE-family HTH domain
MRSVARSLAVEMALQQRATGRRIAQLRERAHLTQEAAADRAGVTLRAFQKWEAGGGIQYSNLQRLAEALRTTVEEITGEAETPSPFKVSDQLDDVTSAFHARVDDVEGRLGKIEQALVRRVQHDEHVEALLEKQNKLLDDQTRLLNDQSNLLRDIRTLVGTEEALEALKQWADFAARGVPADGDAERTTQSRTGRRSQDPGS